MNYERESVSRSVVWDSLQPPARLLCLWNSPGKNTGVGSHSLLLGIFQTQGSNLGLLIAGRFFIIWATKEALVNHCCAVLSRLQLSAAPRILAHQAPLSVGFSRQEYWSGLLCPSPGNLPNPGIKPRSPAFQADSLPTEPPGKPCGNYIGLQIPDTGCLVSTAVLSPPWPIVQCKWQSQSRFKGWGAKLPLLWVVIWGAGELLIQGKQKVEEFRLFQSTIASKVFLTENISQMLVKNRLSLILSMEAIKEDWSLLENMLIPLWFIII